MKRLLVNLGPLVHLSGNGPIAGDLTDETSHVLPAGMAILVNEHVIEILLKNIKALKPLIWKVRL